MDVTTIITALVSALLIPFQLVLVPIDTLLNNINGIDSIPSSISSITQFVGTLPQTLVVLTGANPFLWNTLFLVFVTYIAAAPAINGVKKIVDWVT